VRESIKHETGAEEKEKWLLGRRSFDYRSRGCYTRVHVTLNRLLPGSATSPHVVAPLMEAFEISLTAC
jgi:hypothetical protein